MAALNESDLNLVDMLHCAEDLAVVRERLARETDTQLLEQCAVQAAVLHTLAALLHADLDHKVKLHHSLPVIFGKRA